MSNPFRDDHGIQLNESPATEQTFGEYRLKLSRVNIPVAIKIGGTVTSLHELVHGIGLAEKHLGGKV
jgi:hypothetical protein